MEQNVYELLQSLEGENFHLKNQLARRVRESKKHKNIIRGLKEKLDEKEKKAHYRNGQKRGRNGRNG